MPDPRIEELELVAWVGEDELDSGEIGIKIGLVPAGLIPLAATVKHEHKLSRDGLVSALQLQADKFGKTIRLCRFVYAEEIMVLTPRA